MVGDTPTAALAAGVWDLDAPGVSAAAEPERLEQWGERLLAAPTLEAVFGGPGESGH